MLVFFRADLSIDAGTGHVMRCLSLAAEMRVKGVNCQFICRETKRDLIALISTRGFHIHLLADLNNEKIFGDPREFEKADAEETTRVLGALKADWMIVDHYRLGSLWESLVRLTCKKIMVIDDLADRHHDCDLLLDQTLGRNEKDYSDLVPSHCHVLCGPSFAILRSEFLERRLDSLSRRVGSGLNRILISMGGVDKEDITSEIMHSLQSSNLPRNCEINVVMGAGSPHMDNVFIEATRCKWNAKVMVGVVDMAEVMASCDLAIGAAGSSSWERCCLGIPSILVAIAENQSMTAAELDKAGAAWVVDRFRVKSDLPVKLNLLIDQPITMRLIGIAASRVLDGHGLSRVLSVMGI